MACNFFGWSNRNNTVIQEKEKVKLKKIVNFFFFIFILKFFKTEIEDILLKIKKYL